MQKIKELIAQPPSPPFNPAFKRGRAISGMVPNAQNKVLLVSFAHLGYLVANMMERFSASFSSINMADFSSSMKNFASKTATALTRAKQVRKFLV